MVLCFSACGTRRNTKPLKILPRWTTFRQPRFVAFIIAYSSWLLAITSSIWRCRWRSTRRGTKKDLGPLFMLASVLIIVLQLPLARFARNVGAGPDLTGGLLLLSASFASVALFAATEPPEAGCACCPLQSLVTLLTLGQMLLVPSAKDLIPRFAEVNAETLWRTLNRRRHRGAGGEFRFRQPAGQGAGALDGGHLPVAAAGGVPLCSAVALSVITRPLRR